MSELKSWLGRVLAAQTASEVFAVMDEFRPLLWSDDERATMAKTYNAKLYQLNGSERTDNNEQIEKADKVKAISKQDAGNQRGESTSSTEETDEDEISL